MTSPERPASVAARTILAAGLLCGVMDISAAFVTWVPKGVTPQRLLQGIASGLIGPSSFRHGWITGSLGLLIHFVIACSAAAVFYSASRKLPALLEHPWWAGVGYALVVYVVMYWIVMPLSRLQRSPVRLSYSLIAI